MILFWTSIFLGCLVYWKCGRAANHWVLTDNGVVRALEESPVLTTRPNDVISVMAQEQRWQDVQALYDYLSKQREAIEIKWHYLQTQQQSEMQSSGSEAPSLDGCTHLVDAIKPMRLKFVIAMNGSTRGVPVDEIVQNAKNMKTRSDLREPICSTDVLTSNEEHITNEETSLLDLLNANAFIRGEGNCGTTATSYSTGSGVFTIKFGHELSRRIEHDPNNWMFYNLAVLYWGSKGHWSNALRCMRKTVELADMKHLDIPLHNLAGLFYHQGKHTDAIALLRRACILEPNEPYHYLALGYVHFRKGDLNDSDINFSQYLTLNPNDRNVEAILKLIKCTRYSQENFDVMDAALNNMKDILNEMDSFQQKQLHWLQLSERLIWEQKTNVSKIGIKPVTSPMDSFNLNGGSALNNIHSFKSTSSGKNRPYTENAKMDSTSTSSSSQKSVLSTISSNTAKWINYCVNDNTAGDGGMITCHPRDVDESDWSEFGTLSSSVEKNVAERLSSSKRNAMSSEMNVDKSTAKSQQGDDILQTTTPMKVPSVDQSHGLQNTSNEDESSITHSSSESKRTYSSTKFQSESSNFYFDDTSWPLERDCAILNETQNNEDYSSMPVFVPPESKGYDVKSILGDKIGLGEPHQEHELPWYPPNCDDKTLFKSAAEKVIYRQIPTTDLYESKWLREQLLNYMSNGKMNEAEIGQRIITALKRDVAPPWLLAHLASMYWRMRGNAKKALDCLEVASRDAPTQYNDALMVWSGSLMAEVGITEQALRFANIAHKLNYVEPAANFLLAVLNHKHNPLLAIYHMKNALRSELEFYGGHAKALLLNWACRTKSARSTVKDIPSAKLEPYAAAPKSEKKSLQTDNEVSSILGFGTSISCVQKSVTRLGEHCSQVEIQTECHGTSINSNTDSLDKYHYMGLNDLSDDLSYLKVPGTSLNQLKKILLIDQEHITTMLVNMVHTYESLLVCCSKKFHSNMEAFLNYAIPRCTNMLGRRSGPDETKSRSISYFSVAKALAADLAPNMDVAEPFCDRAAVDTGFRAVNQAIDKLLLILPENEGKRDARAKRVLQFLAADNRAALRVLGAKISMAQGDEHITRANADKRGNSARGSNSVTPKSPLYMAAALYWRSIGNNREAAYCLRHAIRLTPDSYKDVPINSLALLLQHTGETSNALTIGYLASIINYSIATTLTNANILHELGFTGSAIKIYAHTAVLESSTESHNSVISAMCEFLYDDFKNRMQQK